MVAASLLCGGCTCAGEGADADPVPSAAPSRIGAAGAPKILYLPDADQIGAAASALASAPHAAFVPRTRCPAEMVDVGGEFCIDRYEVSLVDAKTERRLSPYYHPTAAQTRASYRKWQKARLGMGSSLARSTPLPDPPEWQLAGEFEPKAVSERGVVPSGYLSRAVAEQACHNAAKRLCTAEEWVTACRGFQRRKYPYGETYVYGTCNVFRPAHPARILHGDASIGHLDPRLNQARFEGEPLLMVTGQSSDCRSEWGADAAYDMVGNLDEWVDEPGGAFLGGFYSRGTEEGCDARIEVHPPEYFDYSLGTRCCR